MAIRDQGHLMIILFTMVPMTMQVVFHLCFGWQNSFQKLKYISAMQHNPLVPYWLDKALEKALSIYPNSRYEALSEWFQDLKLGVIFHYGLYAQAGIVESWQLSEKDLWAREGREFRQDFKQLQLDYWNLISEFNPTQLDAKKWAEDCKAAGFKYCIFTTKHHDGFNLFNTMTTEYKVGGKLSPFKRDILAEVFAAFREEGLGIGAYYSKADWYSQYYWLDDETVKGRNASYDTAAHPEIWQKYAQGFTSCSRSYLIEGTTQIGKSPAIPPPIWKKPTPFPPEFLVYQSAK